MDLDQHTEAALAACASADEFFRIAAERGVALTPAQRAAAARPDPLGIVFLEPFAPDTEHWPSPAWLPVNVAAGPEPAVDWAWFGEPPALLDRAALHQSMARPFNRVFRRRMRLDDFVTTAPESTAPAGFLFHMSRCGSTLAARMFACVPGTLTLSELPTVSETVAMASATRHLDEDRAIALLRALLTAYSRGERKLLIRFDAHNTLALPLVARAFPHTPLAFLYRDPTEVLISYHRDSGIEAAFSGNLAALWNGDDLRGLSKEGVTARGLAKICESAASHIAAHGGLAVNYRDMPGAVADAILPHFGIELDAAAREAMRRIAHTNAKVAGIAFEDDRAQKQRDADKGLRARAETELGTVYRALEELAFRSRT